MLGLNAAGDAMFARNKSKTLKPWRAYGLLLLIVLHNTHVSSSPFCILYAAGAGNVIDVDVW